MSDVGRTPCNAHPNNEFDHTCDDCMFTEPHLDEPDQPESKNDTEVAKIEEKPF